MLTCWSLGFSPLVKARHEDYRVSHLNKVCNYMNTKVPLNLAVLSALAGAGPALGIPMSSID